MGDSKVMSLETIKILLGVIANITSFSLWLPQAKSTWKYRNDKNALKGISIGTPIIACLNTLTWCIYGFITNNPLLSLGTVFILPLSLFTIILKLKAKDK